MQMKERNFAPLITNNTWPELGNVIKIVRDLPARYHLSYNRPVNADPLHPFSSSENPSFDSIAPLNNFQLIWDRSSPRHVWINHGYPDVYQPLRDALTASGYTILTDNPHPFKIIKTQEGGRLLAKVQYNPMFCEWYYTVDGEPYAYSKDKEYVLNEFNNL
jgi:hypothetical protein